jgi:hypothetical protein
MISSIQAFGLKFGKRISFLPFFRYIILLDFIALLLIFYSIFDD